MTEIAIRTAASSEVTLIPNIFIEQYMPQANGEFVKVYLYLLRILSHAASFTLADGADALDCTERDILRALKYWAKEEVLELTFDSDKKLSGIRLLPLTGEPAAHYEKATAGQTAKTAADPQMAAPHPSADNAPASPAPAPKPAVPEKNITRDTLQRLQKDEDFSQLLFIAEQYLGRTLKSTDTSDIAYFYDQLHLSCELIEYLIEYCVGGGHRSISYIRTVALSWHQKGITTVEQAKEESSLFNKTYYTILKCLGISNRNPISEEIAMMNRWMGEWGFTLDIIKEACTRTVMQTSTPTLKYANRILEDWHKHGVHTLADILPLDEKHISKKKSISRTPKAAPSDKNRFNNFHQRDYDYDALEKQLLNR